MPKGFEQCVAEKGRIITKKLPGNKYIHICYDKNGKSHAGEVKLSKPKWKK